MSTQTKELKLLGYMSGVEVSKALDTYIIPTRRGHRRILKEMRRWESTIIVDCKSDNRGRKYYFSGKEVSQFIKNHHSDKFNGLRGKEILDYFKEGE